MDLRPWLRRRPVQAGATAVAVVLVAVSVWLVAGRDGDPAVVVGVPEPATTTALPGPTVIEAPPATEPPTTAASEGTGGGGGGPAIHLHPADGRPYGNAIPFTSSIPVPDRLVFVLVIGSDARPGEPLDRTRADSIHLLAANPFSGQGTIVGFPRDSYVEIPGRGRGKINDALVLGGPNLLAETVRRLTGLPVDYYVLTGFVGLQRMVDELGGVHVLVDRRMNDKVSGALFEPGWHHFDGAQALAYSRNRKDVPNGDFSRSHHQGNLILATMGKVRTEVADDAGLFRWLDVLRRHVRLDVPAGDLSRLAALGRRLDPARVTNVVVPGRIGYAGRTSVVYLDARTATAWFTDLRDDAVLGRAEGPTTTTSAPPPPPTSTTTAPTTTTTSTTTTLTPTSSTPPDPLP